MGSSLLKKLVEKELDGVDSLLQKMSVHEYLESKKIGLNDKMGFGKYNDVAFIKTPYEYRYWLKKTNWLFCTCSVMR